MATAPRLVGVITLPFVLAACAGLRTVTTVPLPPAAEHVIASAVPPDLVRITHVQPGDTLLRLPVDDLRRSVFLRVRPGATPLVFGASCAVVAAADVPPEWPRVCTEYTDENGRPVVRPFGVRTSPSTPRP